jgi:hypothetical protein
MAQTNHTIMTLLSHQVVVAVRVQLVKKELP